MCMKCDVKNILDLNGSYSCFFPRSSASIFIHRLPLSRRRSASPPPDASIFRESRDRRAHRALLQPLGPASHRGQGALEHLVGAAVRSAGVQEKPGVAEDQPLCRCLYDRKERGTSPANEGSCRKRRFYRLLS